MVSSRVPRLPRQGHAGFISCQRYHLMSMYKISLHAAFPHQPHLRNTRLIIPRSSLSLPHRASVSSTKRLPPNLFSTSSHDYKKKPLLQQNHLVFPFSFLISTYLHHCTTFIRLTDRLYRLFLLITRLLTSFSYPPLDLVPPD